MPTGVYVRTKEYREKQRIAHQGKPGMFGKDNPNYGKPRPQSFIDKVSGPNNYGWQGDNVGRVALHEWVRKRLPKTQLCQLCVLKPPQQLSNKTGMYKRELENWWWLCAKCHVYYDGTVNNLRNKPTYPIDHKCVECGSQTTLHNKNGTKIWRHGKCCRCSQRKK